MAAGPGMEPAAGRYLDCIQGEAVKTSAIILPPLFCLIAALAAALPAPVRAENAALDRILVVVNRDVITENEFRNQLNTIKRQFRLARRPLPPEADLKRQVLERMIMERLQLQYAEQTGIRVTKEEVDRALAQIAQRNRLTVDQLRRVLKRDGIDYDQFRRQIRTQVIIGKLIDRDINSRVTVTESEIDSVLASAEAQEAAREEVDLSHIEIGLPARAEAEVVAAARERAERLRARVARGELDFAQAAVRYSQSPDALEGGRLGWKRLGELPEAFARAARRLRPGQVSGVLRVGNGFHILKLHARRGAGEATVTQTHVRHILLKPGPALPVDEAVRRLKRLRERILNGEDFGELAKAHSNDASSGTKGGDLGWVSPGELDPRFEQAMNHLKPGEVSGPVRTRYGVHLIQVLDRRQQDIAGERRRAEIRRQLHERKARERYEQWLHQLRDEAYVERKVYEDQL